jgi:transposase InsO family protein
MKPTQLAPLPIPECPNWRIHADLFGPMLTADSNKKFILCITDAFTKYAVITLIQNKNAETVADAIFKEWFCKFGIPAQIHTDSGKEFINKLSAEMMELLNVAQMKTSPAHPQCNSRVEVFNKTVKKYLASFVDETALNWETFLPALALSYTVTTLQSPQHHSSFCLEKKHGSHHFQMKTFKTYTTEKLLLQKD